MMGRALNSAAARRAASSRASCSAWRAVASAWRASLRSLGEGRQAEAGRVRRGALSLWPAKPCIQTSVGGAGAERPPAPHLYGAGTVTLRGSGRGGTAGMSVVSGSGRADTRRARASCAGKGRARTAGGASGARGSCA